MSGELQRFALIGFGEAGSILGEDLVRAGRDVITYDILLDAPATRARLIERACKVGVRVADGLAQAMDGAQIVISAVTASSSADVATGASKYLRAGQVMLDINSVSPARKLANAKLVEPSGAHYVEAAVMAPLPPQRLKVPMLLGGTHAARLVEPLNALGMNTRAIADRIGVASAVKMCRSVVIKGLESLALESMMAARRFGAEGEVLESLRETFPHMGWTEKLPDYLISRVAEHGRRRAAEMREVARTLQDIGLEPTMAGATAQRQDALIDVMQARGLSFSGQTPFSWRELVDALSGSSVPTPSTASTTPR